MDSMKRNKKLQSQTAPPMSVQERTSHGRILVMPDDKPCLNSLHLDQLEQSFRSWAGESSRAEVQLSRRRILLIFLLIRYTGAKLNEVLALDPTKDIDYDRHSVRLGHRAPGVNRPDREVSLSEAISREIHAALAVLLGSAPLGKSFDVDPGFVRRKFYDRAAACGFSKQMGSPEMIRKARAVELLQNNMPLPAVQMLLGHSTPSLTTAYVSFSADDIRQVTKHFMDRESARKTSARNTFIGKIEEIRQGDIQSQVTLVTIGGERVTTVITNNSLERLGLRQGRLITAEIKAPWVLLQQGEAEPWSTAENRFYGTVGKVTEGLVTTEYVVRIADGTELCAVVTSESCRRLGLRQGDPVWALFNGFSVVLREE